MSELIIITGQTGTGKTKYALNLAKELNGELINCDSRQVYKHLDIITGKDFTEKNFVSVEKKGESETGYYTVNNIPLWLYDVVDPKQYFSSFDYKTCALSVIKKIQAREKTPIIVGGTYLYIKSLLSPFETENIPPNEMLRAALKEKGVGELQEILQEKDPDTFNELNNSDRNNPRRLIRRIEIADFSKTNKVDSANILAPSDLLDSQITAFRFEKKENLIKKIEKRVEERLSKGAIEEVKALLKNRYNADDPGLQTIGYQEIIQHLEGKISKEKAAELWSTSEVQYAKRQLTFMQQNKDITWKNI